MRLRDIILCVVMLLTFEVSRADDAIDKQRSLIATLEKQIASSEREVAQLRKDKAASEERVGALVQQIATRNRLLEAQRLEAVRLRSEVATLDMNATTLSGELEAEREGYAQMVREAYRSYHGRTLLSYIFTSSDFNELAYRMSNVRALAELRRERMDHIDSLSAQLGVQRMALVASQAELDGVVKDLTLQRSRLQSDVDSARATINSMSSRERKAMQQSELAKRQLDTEIKKLQALVIGNQTGASFSAKTSGLTLPVAGGRVKQYMENMAEVLGARGAKVTSIYAGKVMDVKRNKITNNYDVYIAHGEYITSYGGLSQISVAKGDVVARDQQIGVIGESVNIITLESEYKIVFGLYPPKSTEKVSAANCFKR
ncbi:MAG: peptidoglycan DD-metalloendopeptidase family protein [Rikenellaceae bacterium]